MRVVTVAELERNVSAVLREMDDTGSIIVTSEGRPAAVLMRLSEDDLEDYLLSKNVELADELAQAFEECLRGAGRPARDLLEELAE